MSNKRVTILGLLMKENKNKQKRAQTNTVLSETQIFLIIKKAACAILHAQKVISKAVKSWILRRHAKQNKTYLADIYFEADYDIADVIYLVGDFSNPPWSQTIEMKYSFFHRAFRSKVKIRDK